jgi:glycerol kinase
MNIGNKPVISDNGLITTIAAGTGKVEYALEGSVFVAGAAIQWLTDQMKLVNSAPESEEIAEKVSDTNGVYVVPAFTGMGAPYWKQNARGMVVGITRGTAREHFVRATLESLAYQTYDVLKAMENDSGMELKRLRVDGGASANNFLMQFQADLLAGEIVRPVVTETTALGAAYLAGLAVGYYDSIEEIKQNWQVERIFEPQIDEEMRRMLLSGWENAVKRVLL